VKAKKKGMRFPVVVLFLLIGVFLFGTLAGAFIYATGKEVMNTPFMQMVSHTEYRFSEPGQIVARLVDFQGAPIAVINCTATILYPDKTMFVNNALMSATANISGDHYYSFTTPAGPEGTYEYQATCYYTQGTTKSQSVTNSFHLSSAFTSVLGNLTTITTNVGYVQSNLSALSTQLSAVNSSLSGQITSLSSQVAQNISTVISSGDANTAVILGAIGGNTTLVLNELAAINASLSNLNVSVDLTPVLSSLEVLNASIQAKFVTLDASLTGNFSVVGSTLSAMNVTIADTNTKVTSMAAVLDAVNVTTTNLYTYVTGTLAGKVDDVLSGLGVINATVNRIETLSTAVNSTTSQILTNQENAVQMSVFSG